MYLYFLINDHLAECTISLEEPKEIGNHCTLKKVYLDSEFNINVYSDINHDLHIQPEISEMKIYTSYYAKVKNYPHRDRLFSITNASFSKETKYEPLVPPWKLVNDYKKGLITKREFGYAYVKDVLNKLDPYQVLKDLGDGAILLCFEKSGEFCHRRIVAKWLEKKTGITVEEFDY